MQIYYLDDILLGMYIFYMEWEIEFTNEFEEWWNNLDEDEQESVVASVTLLEELGPNLPFPHSSGIKTSRYGEMRELRIQHAGRPYRVFYIFDSRRVAILLLGAIKADSDSRFYREYVPIADKICEQCLKEIREETVKEKTHAP